MLTDDLIRSPAVSTPTPSTTNTTTSIGTQVTTEDINASAPSAPAQATEDRRRGATPSSSSLASRSITVAPQTAASTPLPSVPSSSPTPAPGSPPTQAPALATPVTPAPTTQPIPNYTPSLDCAVSIDRDLSSGKASYSITLKSVDFRGNPLPPSGSSFWPWYQSRSGLTYPIAINHFYWFWVERPSYYNEQGLWQPSSYLIKYSSGTRTDYWQHNTIRGEINVGSLNVRPGDKFTVFLFASDQRALLSCDPVASALR